MSLTSILSSAVSGLSAAQAGLSTASNNVANANSPGYARQRLTLNTGVTAGRTSGVVVGEPERVADRFLEATVYRRAGAKEQSAVQAEYLDRIQSFLGAPGDSAGVPARIDAIQAAAIAMTAPGAASETAANYVASVEDAISSIQQLDDDLSSLRTDINTEVGDSIGRINNLLVQIHDLNASVARQQGLGQSTSGAADQRGVALEELSGLIDVTIREQPNGKVTIETANGAVLLDQRLRQLDSPPSGTGVLASAPSINIRFADDKGVPGALTGESVGNTAVGGRLGGLLDVRDRTLPDLSHQLGHLMGGLGEALNAASNSATSSPPPQALEGRASGLVGNDRLGFTGTAIFAVTDTRGTLIARTAVDFTSLGAGATINDAVNAINAGLGGTATASFVDGKFTLTAASSSNGVVVAQDPAAPSDRAGVGFSHFFGLNDLVRSANASFAPTGFTASDPHGFSAGQTTDLVLRDANGRVLASHKLTGSAGSTFGDLVTEMNASPLGSYGTAAMDARGQIVFTPMSSLSGAQLSVAADTTDRLGTGFGFAALSGLPGPTGGISSVAVRGDIDTSPSKLPIAQFQTSAAIGAIAVGPGDRRAAASYGDQLSAARDFGTGSTTTVTELTTHLITDNSRDAARIKNLSESAATRFDDAVNRRNAYSGVNIDEELANMVSLQNSYAAAARVLSTASEMYDTLISMMG